MATTFEGVLQEYGFDKAASPPWLLVGLADFKAIRLVDGANLAVTSTNAAVATVEEGPSSKASAPRRDLIIRGKAKGTSFIEVHRADRVKGKVLAARLEVNVKPRKTVNVTFNFVEDRMGTKTVRDVADADSWVDELNKIFLPQANIKFVKHGARKVVVNENLGKVVRFSSHLPKVAASQHEWDDVVAKGDATADFNVFLVWEYEQDATPLKDNAGAGTSGANCIFEDKTGEIGRTLGHEAGHFLGGDDTYAAGDKAQLLYGYEDGGRAISKKYALIMNP